MIYGDLGDLSIFSDRRPGEHLMTDPHGLLVHGSARVAGWMSSRHKWMDGDPMERDHFSRSELEHHYVIAR